MRKKVHAQGDERKMMHDDFSFRDSFCWEDPGLSLRNMGLMRQLRSLEDSIRNKLTELEKDPVLNKESIIKERVTLEAAQKELRRLERKTFYEELGE
jgi:hypothetical protein